MLNPVLANDSPRGKNPKTNQHFNILEGDDHTDANAEHQVLSINKACL
jgi:hypothetical protein